MRIQVCAVGRLKEAAEKDLCERYLDRARAIGRGQGVSALDVVETDESQARVLARRREEEAIRLVRLAGEGTRCVLLDPLGQSLASEAFAHLLQRERDGGTARLAFLIGGPDGHGESARRHAALTLSLGALTLPHGLARIVLLEQLYRGLTLLAGHPYHRGT